MKKEKENNKHFDFVIVILREEIFGHKDVDHILPFMYFLSKIRNIKFTMRCLIFENEMNYKNNLDPRIKMLFNLENVDVEFLYKDNFLFHIKSFSETKSNFLFSSYFKRLIKALYLKYIKTKKKQFNIENKVGEIFKQSKSPIIITAHANNEARDAILSIKKINTKAKWMVLPDSIKAVDNQMNVDTYLEKDEKKIIENHKTKFKDIDYFLVSSREDLNDSISKGLPKKKGLILGSPRYSKEWLKIKSSLNLDGKSIPINKKFKVKILFFIPKKHINIFHEELIRTLDFISKYKEIELILSCADFIYPYIPKHILSRKNLRRYLIAEKYSTSKLIDWADIVMHAGTGVIFESFIKQKITVLPRYLSSNTMISERYNAGINLKNRDELRNLCNNAIKSLNSLKKNYKKKFGLSNKKYINDFVNSNSDFMKKNIEKILSKI